MNTPGADAPLVFVAEDEPKMARILVDYLTAFGFRSCWIDCGDEVVAAVKRDAPDLLLLDLMLPGKDGLAICRELRAFTDLPIIMTTARVEEIDRLLGLELGADDYICKPFSPREVMARVKAVLRRFRRGEDPAADAPIQLNHAAREATILGNKLDLTPNEFELLGLLAGQPGRVFSRDQLLAGMRPGFRPVADRAVDSHVKNLRKKLAAAAPGRELIVSVYGVGYKLTP